MNYMRLIYKPLYAHKKTILVVFLALFIASLSIIRTIHCMKYISGFQVELYNTTDRSIHGIGVSGTSTGDDKKLIYNGGTYDINNLVYKVVDQSYLQDLAFPFLHIAPHETISMSRTDGIKGEGLVLVVPEENDFVRVIPISYIASRSSRNLIKIYLMDGPDKDEITIKIKSFNTMGSVSAIPWWIRIFYDYTEIEATMPV